jgi:hypothetical protein
MEDKRECQAIDYGPYSYGAQYPCYLLEWHKGPHQCLDKDDCPHNWYTPGTESRRKKKSS